MILLIIMFVNCVVLGLVPQPKGVTEGEAGSEAETNTTYLSKCSEFSVCCFCLSEVLPPCHAKPAFKIPAD